MAIYIQIMSKRTHVFKSVGRVPPPFPLSRGKVPQREPHGSSTSARARVRKPQERWRTPATSAVDRRALSCLHNHPRTWWEHTLIHSGVNQATEWHRAARQEFRQQGAINSHPPVVKKLVMECDVPTLLPPCKGGKGRGGGRKHYSSRFYGMPWRPSKYSKDRPLFHATVVLLIPRHYH